MMPAPLDRARTLRAYISAFQNEVTILRGSAERMETAQIVTDEMIKTMKDSAMRCGEYLCTMDELVKEIS